LVPKELFLAVHNIREEKRSQGFVHDKENENLPLKIFTQCDKYKEPLTGFLVKKKGLHYLKIIMLKSNLTEVKRNLKLLRKDLLWGRLTVIFTMNSDRNIKRNVLRLNCN